MSVIQALSASLGAGAAPSPDGGSGVTIDNITSVSFHGDNGPGKMHVVGASANYLLAVIARDGAGAVNYFTFNGVAMTPINVDSNFVFYGLANPTVGNHAVNISWTGNHSGCLGVYSFNGASGVGTFVHNTVDCVSPSVVTVASAVGGIVVDLLSGYYGNTYTPDVSQTTQFTTFDGGSAVGGPSSTKPGAASVTMSWAIGGCPILGAVSVNP